MITSLKENEIFVFGSNLNGNHAGGAARQAVESFGALNGKAVGLQGQSYALPTLDENMQKFSTDRLKLNILAFYEFASRNRDKIFLLTKIGQGIAGYTNDEISAATPDFTPENVIRI